MHAGACQLFVYSSLFAGLLSCSLCRVRNVLDLFTKFRPLCSVATDVEIILTFLGANCQSPLDLSNTRWRRHPRSLKITLPAFSAAQAQIGRPSSPQQYSRDTQMWQRCNCLLPAVWAAQCHAGTSNSQGWKPTVKHL